MKIVIDTNEFVAGMRSSGGASRLVLRKALTSDFQPLFGNALWMEYMDLMGRDVWGSESTIQEREAVLAALAQKGRWVNIYYAWRPNLPDEGDNHLVELAIAGGSNTIVTHNVKDPRTGELHFTGLDVLLPTEFLEGLK
jgi:predicted nucleic acid-binding protein